MISWFMENITVSPKEREEPLTFTFSSNWETRTQANFIVEVVSAPPMELRRLGGLSVQMAEGKGNVRQLLTLHVHRWLPLELFEKQEEK